MISFGEVPASSTLPIFFDTFAGATGAPITMTNFAIGDVLIYKGTSMTQRSSTAGIVLIDTDGVDLDGITGIQGVSIDLSDNTDAGFYATGSFFTVVISTVTIDSQTVSFVAATFRIRVADATSGTPVVDVGRINNVAATSVTTINANVGTTQPINFTGTGASALVKDDVVDIAGAAVSTSTAQLGVNAVQAGATAWNSGAIKTTSFTAGAIDAAAIATDAIGAAELADGAITAATFAAGAIDATAIATGAIDADALAADASTEINTAVLAVLGALNNAAADGDPTNTDTMVAYLKQLINTLEGSAGVVTYPAAAVAASGVSLAEVIRSIDTRLPAALSSGNIKSDVFAMQADVVTASAMATDSIDAAAIKADAVTEINAAIVALLPTALGANGNLKADVRDWVGTAVATPKTAGVPLVDDRATILRTNTATAGGASTITLDAGASATTGFYLPCGITIISGTGAGQSAVATGYNGGTKVLTITPAWGVQPDNTSVFILWPSGVDAVAMADGPITFAPNSGVVRVDVLNWLGTQPNALTLGRVDAIVGAMSDGTIGSATFQSGAIDATAIAADAIGSSELAASAVTEIQSGLATSASISALNNLSAAQVNAEVVDALATDTYAEPGQAAPGATASLAAKINYLYKAWRNKKTSDGTTFKLFADDASTVDQKAALSDSGGTTTVGEVASGP